MPLSLLSTLVLVKEIKIENVCLILTAGSSPQEMCMVLEFDPRQERRKMVLKEDNAFVSSFMGHISLHKFSTIFCR